jgi:hypothetical protein
MEKAGSLTAREQFSMWIYIKQHLNFVRVAKGRNKMNRKPRLNALEANSPPSFKGGAERE